MRRAMAWAAIIADSRLQQQLTQGQAADAKDKAKSGADGARRAVRNAWSHILYPIKTDATEAGRPFELEHLSLSAKDKGAIPAGVYDKARADGVAMEKIGPDSLWLKIKPLWPDDRPHLAINELVEWFASYVYLPKVRDRVVLEAGIRDALAKFDAPFGYAESVEAATGAYSGLTYAKSGPEFFAPSGLLVRAEAAVEQIKKNQEAAAAAASAAAGSGGASSAPPAPTAGGVGASAAPAPAKPAKPHRFYGAVEIDMARPVKNFDTILNAVVMELQRTPGAKVKITLEIEADATGGFDETEVSVLDRVFRNAARTDLGAAGSPHRIFTRRDHRSDCGLRPL